MGNLFHTWERRAFWTAFAFAGLTLLVSIPFAAAFRRVDTPVWLTLALCGAPPVLVYAGMTRKIRRRRRLLSQPFPSEWEMVLQHEVAFYRALSAAEKERSGYMSLRIWWTNQTERSTGCRR